MQLIDTVEVAPELVDDYLTVLRTLGLRVMTDAGASFVSCATTSAGIGEPVSIQVIWAFEDHEQWNEIRKNMVLDSRYHDYGNQLASLRMGGTRRFFTPVTFPAP